MPPHHLHVSTRASPPTPPPSDRRVADSVPLVPMGGMVEVARLPSREQASGLAFTLESVGIRCRIAAVWESENGAGWQRCLLVPADQAARARHIVAEELAGRRASAAEPTAETERRAVPSLAWVVGIVVVNLLVWIAMEGSGGSEARETLLRFGASHAPTIRGGHLWVVLTAVFLHIGLKHLLANMVTLAVLGAPVLRTFGVGRFLTFYLFCGVAGNLVSFAISPTGSVKAGASGAILGLLGVLAGERIRQIRAPRAAAPSRFKTWHIVAMLVAFYGFVVGVGPADHLAHLGGLAAGLLLGLFAPRLGELSPRTDTALDLALGSLAISLCVAAAAAQALVVGPG